MADLLDEAHADAGLDLLRADAGLVVCDGQVPDGTQLPYVLVYTTVRWPSGEAGAANPLTGHSVTCTVEWNIHCVGESAGAARAIQMRVRAALLNQRPAIVGRSVGLIKQDEVLPPVRDETTGRLLVDGVANYSLITTP